MRNGGWMTSLSCANPNSGTARPLSGKSASRSTCAITSRSNRSPTSGICCTAYQARMASRSSTAEAAKLTWRLCAMSGQTETLLDRGEVGLAALLEVHQALDDVTQKDPLFALCLIVGQGLHDRDTATAAGQEHRPARLVDLVHDLAGVDLHLGQRHDIFGELGDSHDSSAQSPVYGANTSTVALVCEEVCLRSHGRRPAPRGSRRMSWRFSGSASARASPTMRSSRSASRCASTWSARRSMSSAGAAEGGAALERSERPRAARRRLRKAARSAGWSK